MEFELTPFFPYLTRMTIGGMRRWLSTTTTAGNGNDSEVSLQGKCGTDVDVKAGGIVAGRGLDLLEYFAGAYWMALPTWENTLLEFEPMSRIVPTTMTSSHS